MSEQTQPGTALQSLAEKLRTDAIAIFGDGQAERDIIEWFYGSLLAAAPAQPAVQEAYPECDYCGVTPDHHPWHGSGLLGGVESRHIHACDSCRHLLPASPAQPEVQSLREALERATKLLSAAAGYATKMEPMPAKLLNAIDAELDASTGQEVEK